uniref:Uncharacterized protein n=1 Tax=Romanomermis culicivorax TaxID=13658 RepID=A0A915L0B4_ROMCU
MSRAGWAFVHTDLKEFQQEDQEMSQPPNGRQTMQYLVRDPHVAYGQLQLQQDNRYFLVDSSSTARPTISNRFELRYGKGKPEKECGGLSTGVHARMDVRSNQMLDESSLITIAEGPTLAEIEVRLREQAEKEIERQKEIFVKKLAEQKARLDEQQKQLEQVLAGFTAQPTPLAAATIIQASDKPPTVYHILKLAALPASTQVIQPAVSKSMLIAQGPQRDLSIDGGIPDVYTAEEVKPFRDSGPTDDQIRCLGRRKIPGKANRAKNIILI